MTNQVVTQLSLQPARVLECSGTRVHLQRSSDDIFATLALAYPYQPEPGDIVLTIGDETVYVIGVLTGRGKTRFRVHGDLQIEAGGAIDITSRQAVRLKGPHLAFRFEKIDIVAGTVIQKIMNSYQWIRETLELRSGRMRTIVEGQQTTTAERIVQNAVKDVKIDGSQIHLG